MLLYFGGGRTVEAMPSLPQAAGGASSSGLASTSPPWITAGWCQLCDVEASSAHLGGKRHKKSLASDPLSWKHAWSFVPEDFLGWAAKDAAHPAASAAAATAAAQSEAVRSNAAPIAAAVSAAAVSAAAQPEAVQAKAALLAC